MEPYGQLGYGDTNNRGDGPNEMGDNLPTVDLGSGKKAKFFEAGYYHTCAVLNDDTVKCWGKKYGQLGYGDTKSRIEEIIYQMEKWEIIYQRLILTAMATLIWQVLLMVTIK